MAARFPFSPHALLRTLIGVGLAGLGAAALAKEPSPVQSAPAASSPPASREPATEPQAKPALDGSKRVIKLPSAQNPLDRVRERLAEKLGAPRPAPAQDPNTMRFVTRASDSVAVAASAPRARPVRVHAPLAPATPASPALLAASLAATHRADAHAGAEPAHWDYGGTGTGAAMAPEHWGELKPEFAKCSSGNRQSPIDIRDGIKVDLDPVQFDYKPSAFRVVDNGHTVQVNVGPGSSIEVSGRRYDLVQFHFHRPSEERVNGKQFDMVAHLVHKDIDGRLAVVAVLLDRGAAHPLVQSVWNNLPLEKGDEVTARATLDLNTLLPTERSYYTYMGSLTTPPCSEGVLWMVMKAPMPISAEQINIFARLYPMNARPIQAPGGRLIKESN